MAEAEILTPSDFSGINRLVWGHILSLHANEALEPRALVDALNNMQDWRSFSDVGNNTPDEVVASYLNNQGTNIKNYVERVLGAGIRRSLVNTAALIAAEAENDEKHYEELLEYAERKILSLRRARNDRGITMAELFNVYNTRFDGLRSGEIQPAWIPHLKPVRDIVDFVSDTEFILVAARPGSGKSSSMRMDALEAAKKGKRIVMFNYDNDEIDYAMHFVSYVTGINNKYLRNPKRLPENQLHAVKEAMREVARYPLTIVTPSINNVSTIINTARRMYAEDQFDILMVDYIQSLSNSMKNRNEDVGFSSNRLRSLGQELKVPVIAAAQFSRDVEKRNGPNNGKPQLSDLRDSGTLEQDATIIMSPQIAWNNPNPTIDERLQFPENRDPRRPELAVDRPRAVPIIYHVLKNRNGEIGETNPIKWDKATNRYEEIQRSAN